MAVHTVTAKEINALAGRDDAEGGGTFAALRLLVTRFEDRFAYWLRYRATLAELSDLTDRQLADVGVSRSDIVATARSAARQTGA